MRTQDRLIIAVSSLLWAVLAFSYVAQNRESIPKSVTPDELAAAVATGDMPPFPKASLAAGISGVAVARLVVAETGRVVTVEMLEAPDPEIREAVATTLRGWRFDVGSGEERRRREGKVILYYCRDSTGAGVVLGHRDMRRRDKRRLCL